MGYENVVFPEGSKFLITGVAGFIGSNLAETIVKMGYEVRGLDNLSTGKLGNLESVMDNPNFKFINGDIRSSDTCGLACEGIDYVLHQAALGSVPRSMKEPLIYEDNNIKGTANIFEAARNLGVKRVVYASSSSIYGDSIKLPKREGEEGNVLSPYALTKKISEEYGKLYTDLYNVECIGLRYFNVFGRKQDPHGTYAAVIPNFVKKILGNENPLINGDGTQSRDFTYIENVIEANLKACISPKASAGKAFNIAYGGQESINELCRKINRNLGKNIEPIYGKSRPGDIMHSNADISKAQELLGYEPEYDLSIGLKLATDWYIENL